MGCRHKPVGRNILCDFFGVGKDRLTDLKAMETVLKDAALRSGTTPLKTVSYRFDTGGFSLGILISESHFWIHTYPDEGIAFLDIFTCGEEPEPEKGKEYVKEYLRPEGEKVHEVSRG